ncbi:MAG: hypothetical protein ACRDRI_17750 [Pseudonocardiaceae bacterium]
MTEHDPGPAQQADPARVLRCVTLPELAIIVPLDEDGEADGTGLIHTDLDGVVSRWAPWDHSDLVLVTT